ncbi:MAG: copper amine oxidase N-terminal domain-containing protein [bacterium]
MKKNIIIKNMIIGFVFVVYSNCNNLDIGNKFNINNSALEIVYANSNNNSNSKKGIKYDTSINLNIVNATNNIILTGNYPLIGNLGSTWFQLEVNNRIKSEIDKISSTYSSNQKIVDISYDAILSDDYLSIILYFKNVNTGETEVKSLNIDISNNSLVSINEILGSNGYSYVNKIILNEASNQNITYKKVDANTAFYIKNTNIHIIYGAGELTFSQKGNIIFEVISDNINNFKINEFYSKSNYNVKMTPLREILEYFEYEVQWVSLEEPIKITRYGVDISYITLNLNKYITQNKFEKELEFAPELVNGTTYVPISFFSEVLDMLIDIDNYGNIIISEYNL